eukprot:563216-Prorocentrum_minimum.AAC.1
MPAGILVDGPISRGRFSDATVDSDSWSPAKDRLQVVDPVVQIAEWAEECNKAWCEEFRTFARCDNIITLEIICGCRWEMRDGTCEECGWLLVLLL